MPDYALGKNQKGLTEAFESEIAKEVERYRWNVGNPMGEDRILPKTVKCTPTVMCEILFNWLEENDKVVLPGGMLDKDKVVRTHLKPAVYSAASHHLDKNNNVLLPDGTTVSVEKVEIQD